MMDPENLIPKAAALQALILSQHTLMLSTVSESGAPDLSYAPFIRDQVGCFYILISELASHTVNLLAKPHASVMIIRPEAESSNLFARERAIFNCSARKVDRHEAIYSDRLTTLQDKFGDVVTVLRSLADFHLMALCPQNGRYIVGFGQAYTIELKEGNLMLSMLTKT